MEDNNIERSGINVKNSEREKRGGQAYRRRMYSRQVSGGGGMAEIASAARHSLIGALPRTNWIY
jgi:hypothetical protein